MTTFQLFAFYVVPIVVTLVAIAGAWLLVRSDQRRDRMHPGE